MFNFFRKPPFEQVLRDHLDADFKVFPCGADAPHENEIKKFEKTIGYDLPKDFRTFSISPLGGIYIEVLENIWPRPKAYAVGPFWNFLYAVMVLSFSKKAPDWLQIEPITLSFQKQTQSKLTPFLKIMGDADYYCFTPDKKIIRWRHETGEHEPVALTFAEVFKLEVSELRSRKDKMKKE